MARRFILSDDLTGNESEDVRNHVYMVDNVFYEIDLSDASFDLFEKAMADFVKVSRETRRITATAKGEASQAERIRQWAKANGMEVAERGRLSDEIVEAFDKAHAGESQNGNDGDAADSAPDASQEAAESAPDANAESANNDSEKANTKAPANRK